jgi:hypothetical protein
MQHSDFYKREKRASLSTLFGATARLRIRFSGTLFSRKARMKHETAQQFEAEGARSFSNSVPEPAFRAQSDAASEPEYRREPEPDAARASERVVLFAPGPVTEAEFYRDSRKAAAVIRRRRRRGKRTRWMAENAGTILVVAMLLVVAWIMSAR